MKKSKKKMRICTKLFFMIQYFVWMDCRQFELAINLPIFLYKINIHYEMSCIIFSVISRDSVQIKRKMASRNCGFKWFIKLLQDLTWIEFDKVDRNLKIYSRLILIPDFWWWLINFGIQKINFLNINLLRKVSQNWNLKIQLKDSFFNINILPGLNGFILCWQQSLVGFSNSETYFLWYTESGRGFWEYLKGHCYMIC